MGIVFRNILQLINKDRIVLYPAMIGGFFSTWVVHAAPTDPPNKLSLILYLGISWAVSLFLQLLTAEIGTLLLKNKKLNFPRLVGLTFLRFLPAMLWTGVLAGATAILLLFSKSSILLGLLLLPVAILLSIILQVYPISYVYSQKNALEAYLLLFKFIREHFKLFLYISIFLILTSFVFMLTTALLQALSASFALVLTSLWQGLANVVMCYGILLLWSGNVHKVQVQA